MCKLIGLTTLKTLEKTQRSSSWHVPWPARCSNNAASLCETLQSVFNRTTGHLSRLPSPPTDPETLQLTTEEVGVFTRKVTVHISFSSVDCLFTNIRHKNTRPETYLCFIIAVVIRLCGRSCDLCPLTRLLCQSVDGMFERLQRPLLPLTEHLQQTDGHLHRYRR